MENEVITQETTLCPEEIAEQNTAVPTEETEDVVQDTAEQLAELENALQEAKIKLALLVGGASREKLETALEGRMSPLNYATKERIQACLDSLN